MEVESDLEEVISNIYVLKHHDCFDLVASSNIRTYFAEVLLNQMQAWLLKIALVHEVSMCTCLCIHP